MGLITFNRGFGTSVLFSPQRELTQVVATVASRGDKLQFIFFFNLQLAINTSDVSKFSRANAPQRAEYIRQFVEAVAGKLHCGTN